MSDVAGRCKAVDRSDDATNVEAIAQRFRNSTNCDPGRDRLFVEIEGRLIAFTKVWWVQDADGTYRYMHRATLDPSYRTSALERMLLRHSEERLRQIAAHHPHGATRVLETGSIDPWVEREALLREAGYQAVRCFYDLVWPLADPVASPVLPVGLAVRPATAADYQAVWEALQEGWRDQWGFVEQTEDDYQRWLRRPTFSPDLWQVAWDGDQLAGVVLNAIDHAANEESRRRRGYAEHIVVRRPWRRRGLARALLLRSLLVLQRQGLDEALLTVDAENPSGALRLYEAVGFKLLRRNTAFRKPLPSSGA